MEFQNIIQQAQRGDAKAMARLYQEHYPFLLKYLIKITLQPLLAEDLAQDTMIKSIEKLHLYNGQSKFSSWLITIASRLYIDYLRRQKRERAWREQEQALRSMRWQTQSNGFIWPELLDTLSTLTPELRIPVIMRHYYGYSQDEIAKMLDIPSGTVKSRVHNGLKRLRKELEQE